MRTQNKHTARAYGRWQEKYAKAMGKDITPWAVQTWLDTLAATGYSSSSIGQARAAMVKAAKARRLRGELERDDLLALALEVETPRGSEGGRPRRWLSVDEMRTLMAAFGAARTAAMAARNRVIGLMLTTLGLREREICAARWEDVVRAGGEVVQLRVRGKFSTYETVDVPGVLADALAAWETFCPAVAGTPLVRRVWKSGAISSEGVGESSIFRLVVETAARAGLGHVSPHDCRASVSGILFDAEVPIEDISRLLRHKDQAVTRRYIGKRGAKAGLVMGQLMAETTALPLALPGMG